MRHFLLALFAGLTLAGCDAADTPAPAGAQETQAGAALALTGRVVDAAELLEPADELALTEWLAAIEERTESQVVVVTTPSLGGADIADYARDLGNAWGIGHAERDDGLLVVVAPAEKQVRIAVGLGLEDRISDAEAQEIIETMMPYFRTGRFPEGLARGVDLLRGQLENTSLEQAA